MNRKIKTIIVDDIKKIAEMNKEIAIKNENIEVVGMAFNGKEELNMILELKPDLVITDNKMPEMDGIEVIEKVNSLEIENKPEFILVTGDCSLELNRKCSELGVFSVVNKLSAETNLLYTIEEYVTFKNCLSEKVTEEKVVSMNTITQNNTNTKNGIFKRMLEKMKREV